MRIYPNLNSESDKKEIEILNAQDWQLDLLKFNPNYTSWGCFEDYMCKKGDSWDCRIIQNNWKEHISDWGLDEYNELVNFYFEIHRKHHNCEHCDGSSLNPATKKISDDWYGYNSEEDWIYCGDGSTKRWNNAAWCNHITDIEVDALMKSGRIKDVSGFHGYYDTEKKSWVTWINGNITECEKPNYPTAEEVNEWNRTTSMGHDGINKWACVKARAKYLGVYGNCEHCIDGSIYDEDTAKVALQLWYLHPRKGCSRGVYIENIEQDDVSSIFEYLKEARDRNTKRFSKIV